MSGPVQEPSTWPQRGGVIRLFRQREGRDRLRKYRVQIDGQVAGQIGRGETADFFVQPGEHRVRLVIDKFFTSPERAVLLQPGELAEFTCGPGALAIESVLIILWPHRYISLDGPFQRPAPPPCS